MDCSLPINWQLGATPLADGRTRLLVWAPKARRVRVHLVAPVDRFVRLKAIGAGYHAAEVEGAPPGTRYFYRLDDRVERPDPASHFQPLSVHGPSEVVDPTFAWQDASWQGRPLADYVLYELHVGTFSPEGTFAGVIPELDALVDLGVNAIELMPLAQFSGRRNWGYDGVYPFAVQNSYGGPRELKRLVDECHRRGLAVVLDVVYNHIGPEGNYLADFGPYFSRRHHTPWGPAINFEGAGSDEVRRYFIENALRWNGEFHIDALRLDAIHAVVDQSADPFLAQLAQRVHEAAEGTGSEPIAGSPAQGAKGEVPVPDLPESGPGELKTGHRHLAREVDAGTTSAGLGASPRFQRPAYLIAETNRNDPRIFDLPAHGGYQLDAQWLDDFARAVEAYLTGQRDGFYADYGRLADIARSYSEGYVLAGQYSRYRHRHHGQPSSGVPPERFFAYLQTHDQIGNRPLGDRLSSRLAWEPTKLAAATLILSPYPPLLFMGEEYGEPAPFHYFVDHEDPALVQRVREGRRRDFIAWRQEPADPGAESTFNESKLNHALRQSGRHRTLWLFYRELLRLRREIPALNRRSRDESWIAFDEEKKILLSRSKFDRSEACLILAFGAESTTIDVGQMLALEPAAAELAWTKRLDSTGHQWRDPADDRPAGPTMPELWRPGEPVVMTAHSATLYVCEG